MINIHNKANLVPDVTVSFSQIPTIPKDFSLSLSLYLSLSNTHTEKKIQNDHCCYSILFFF